MHHELRRGFILSVVFHEFSQFLLTTLVKCPAKFLIVPLRCNIVRVRISPKFYDMQRHHLGSIMLRDRERVAIRPDRELRKINRAKDEFNFQHDYLTLSHHIKYTITPPLSPHRLQDHSSSRQKP